MKKLPVFLLLIFCLPRLPAATSESAATQPSVAEPDIPHRDFNVGDYGAVADGKTMNTAAIAKAIDACNSAGGGRVVFPAGNYLTAHFSLQSSIDLHLDKGATILFSDKPADYTVTNHRVEDFLTARGCHDVAISGEGTIDGQGAFWWKNYVLPRNAAPNTPTPDHRPFMVSLTDCQRVRVTDVTLTNSPMFHLVPQGCRDVTIDGIKILAPANAPNTDGIDPSGFNFRISNCTIDVGDDNIAIKPSRRIDPNQPSCKDFLIENCTFLHGHGMSIGNPTPGGLKGLIVRNCTFENTDTGIRMKTSRGAGGIVEDCTYQDLTMKNVKNAILITAYYPRIPPDVENDPSQPVGPGTPIYRHIRIENLTANGGGNAGQIVGLAEMPVSDVEFNHVNITAQTGMRIIHAKDIRFVDSTITAASGPETTLLDAEVTGLKK